MGANRPTAMQNASVRLYQGWSAVSPAKALPLLLVADAYA